MRKTPPFLLLSCLFLLTGCGSKKTHHLDPNALAGMTKDEVLTLAFAKCSNATTGVLFIDIQEINNAGSTCFAGHEFKTLADAKSAAVLKDRDIWELDEIKVSTSSFPFSAREGLVLYFNDGRVVKVGTRRISDM
jgi:hypothetical protein